MKKIYLNYIYVTRGYIETLERMLLDYKNNSDQKFEIRNKLTTYHCKMYWCCQKLAGL
jgi:hypothetical protein